MNYSIFVAPPLFFDPCTAFSLFLQSGEWVTGGGGGMEARVVQITDEPIQILARPENISIFVPAEEVDELVAKTRRGSVEIAECPNRLGADVA